MSGVEAIRCRRCDEKNAPHWRFCAHCGLERKPAQPEGGAVGPCWNCGSRPGLYCVMCFPVDGHRLATAIREANDAPPAPSAPVVGGGKRREQRAAERLQAAIESEAESDAHWADHARFMGSVEALTAPSAPVAVPRPHCGRCDRCGWVFDDDAGGCRPGDCSTRPLPNRRDTCAGCGAPFDDSTKGTP